MPTRNVVLTDRQASMVERLVRSGRYQNASEVLRDGLRLVETREAEESARLHALRAAAQLGAEDFAHGRYSTLATDDALAVHLESLTRLVLDAHGSGLKLG